MSLSITLTVNGAKRTLDLGDPRVTLLDLLRERLDLTGTKKGCDRGQCGACTILIDGRRTNSCLALAISHDGADILTIEGLAQGDVPEVLAVGLGDPLVNRVIAVAGAEDRALDRRALGLRGSRKNLPAVHLQAGLARRLVLVGHRARSGRETVQGTSRGDARGGGPAVGSNERVLA